MDIVRKNRILPTICTTYFLLHLITAKLSPKNREFWNNNFHFLIILYLQFPVRLAHSRHAKARLKKTTIPSPTRSRVPDT